ncbi:hypothetical protein [Agrobacterium vitis]|uniref:hypothetical protein n=1 Tax=Agrobacterium vitis TaxID=373 RepID=UPI001F4203C8|nr:hypothetical protein [Agrobacterium vitis]
MAEFKTIPIDQIVVPERLRAVEEDHALAIAQSIVEHGLLNPITVRSTRAAKGGNYTLGATPAQLPSGNISVVAILGGATVTVQTTDDAATTAIQIYCSAVNDLDTSADAVGSPIAVEASRSYSVAVGDATRSNMLVNGSFDSSSSWTLGGGWDISSNAAVHSPGTAGTLSQAVTLTAGATYRLSYDLTRSAGSIQPKLTGGTTVAGTTRSASATVREALQAVSGNSALALATTDAFDGRVDNVVLYLETSTCLPQGTNYLWLEPQNANGVSGPITGPFTVSVQ